MFQKLHSRIFITSIKGNCYSQRKLSLYIKHLFQLIHGLLHRSEQVSVFAAAEMETVWKKNHEVQSKSICRLVETGSL